MADESGEKAVERGDGLTTAHVLFLDIVGYSKLSMEQQRHALLRLQEIVRGTLEVGRAEGQRQLLTLPTGDGMALVFFTPTALAPVQCAIEIGRELQAGIEFALRMGMHSGPVYQHSDIRVNENVVGGGINLAQRVMDCGDAGHILLSKAVADMLVQLGGWEGSLQDLGEIKVKHKLRVHVFNLYTPEAGNKEPPQKYRRQRALRRAAMVAFACILLAVVALAGFRPWGKLNGPIPSPTATPPQVEELALTYWLTITRRRDGRSINATGREMFDTGDEFSFSITPARSGALYIFNEGTSGDWHVLFPTNENNQLNAGLAAMETITTKPNVFTNRSGVEKGGEKVWFIWVKRPMDWLDRIVRAAAKTGWTLADPSHRDALGEFMREHGTTRPEALPVEGPNNQTTLRGRGEVLIHPLELEHADWK